MAIGRFPHCDQRVLHPRGDCSYCDAHPEWQELREAWGIAFTGQSPEDGQLPCPADAARPPGSPSDHSNWGGNVASTVSSRVAPDREPAPVLSRLTTDPNDPRLGRGANDKPGEQNEAYLVLSAEERAEGYVRPVRISYKHLTCGQVTTMGWAIAETYAHTPAYYGATWCGACAYHLPVGEHGEFVWLDDGTKVGT